MPRLDVERQNIVLIVPFLICSVSQMPSFDNKAGCCTCIHVPPHVLKIPWHLLLANLLISSVEWSHLVRRNPTEQQRCKLKLS